jgi:hypothetical protein
MAVVQFMEVVRHQEDYIQRARMGIIDGSIVIREGVAVGVVGGRVVARRLARRVMMRRREGIIIIEKWEGFTKRYFHERCGGSAEASRVTTDGRLIGKGNDCHNLGGFLDMVVSKLWL